MRRQERPLQPATQESATPAHNMARSFNGSSAYLQAALTISEPFSVAGWLRPTTTGTSYTIISLSTNGGTARFTLTANNVGNGCSAFSVNSGGSAGSGIVGSESGGKWRHYGAIFASATSRTAYLDGLAGTTDVTNIAVSGADRVIVGARINAGSYGTFASGAVCDSAIWNTSLTSAEWQALANGVRPLSIRPESLVFYNPLDDRWTYDRARGLFLSDVGPTGAAEDPPFLQKPRRKYFLFGSSAAARRKTKMIFA